MAIKGDSKLDERLNEVAVRCFRDIADQDYLSARLSYFHKLPVPALWQSQQAIEKYLKCILLLHRIRALEVGHDLTGALNRIEKSGSVRLGLSPATQSFIGRLDEYGAERYLSFSYICSSPDFIWLDRAVWELRRFCTLDGAPSQLTLVQGETPPRYSISGGWLEEVLSGKEDERRNALIKKNAFFGRRRGKKLSNLEVWEIAVNSPFWLDPGIVRVAADYIRIPRDLLAATKSLL